MSHHSAYPLLYQHSCPKHFSSSAPNVCHSSPNRGPRRAAFARRGGMAEYLLVHLPLSLPLPLSLHLPLSLRVLLFVILQRSGGICCCLCRCCSLFRTKPPPFRPKRITASS